LSQLPQALHTARSALSLRARAASPSPRWTADIVTPFAFGAKADGRTGDTAALDAAYEHARQRHTATVAL